MYGIQICDSCEDLLITIEWLKNQMDRHNKKLVFSVSTLADGTYRIKY